MGSRVITLKSILLNEECDYTLDDLKEELGLTKDKNLINFFLQLLEGQIEDANFDTMLSEDGLIEQAYDYLTAFIVEDRQCDISSVVKRLKIIKSNINKQLVRINQSIKLRSEEPPLFKKTFWQNFAELNNKLLSSIDITQQYKLDDTENSNYLILNDLVFNIKNFHLLQSILYRYPSLYTIRDKDKQPFFIKLVTFYVELLEDEKTTFDDVIYYNAVVNLFCGYQKMDNNKNLRELINNVIDRINHNHKMDKKIRKQRLIFLRHIKKRFMNEDCYVDDVNELYRKYKRHIIIPNNEMQALTSYFKRFPDRYHDFTDKEVVTIDPLGSIDIDDALSLERLSNNNYLLGIYIADVSSYIPFNSDDDIEAVRRGETIYSDHETISYMLPQDITLKFCSLLPGQPKRVIAHFIEIDPDGYIKSHISTRGLIQSKPKNRLSYGVVDNVLTHGCPDKEMFKLLNNMYLLSTKGEVNNLMIEELGINEESYANLFVSKYMVLINAILAEKASKEGVPFLYRNHQVREVDYLFDRMPSLEELVYNFNVGNHGETIKKMISGSFSYAYYSNVAYPHDGLMLPVYAHTSAPIRRYSDLMNQRLIKLFLIDGVRDDKINLTMESVVREVADRLNANRLIVDQYKNDYAHILRRRK